MKRIVSLLVVAIMLIGCLGSAVAEEKNYTVTEMKKDKWVKVEQKDGYLRFYTSAPTLAVWAELFAEDNALRMAPSALSPCVTRRLSKGEDAVDVAAEIMRAYNKCATAQDVNKS